MSGALKNVNYRNAPVTTKLPGQVENSTGGFVYEVSDRSRLERFLILGTDGGTYYATEQDITEQNVSWLIELIQKDSGMVLSTVLSVSSNGRAYRNDAALFVLALILNHGSDQTKQDAVWATPSIARTATHLYSLAQYLENLGGWGRAKRRAVGNWFTSRTADSLAYQAVKYRQRDGWTLRDAMRLSHPVGVDQRVGNFILKGETDWSDIDILSGYSYMSKASTLEGPSGVLGILQAYPNLPWETIPTQFLKSPEVWKNLFYNGQLTGQALVRNVVRLAKISAFDDMVFARDYAERLTSPEMIHKTRLHPIQYLMAQVTYTEGQVNRNDAWSLSRQKNWSTSPKIISALNEGFYEAFSTVDPSNKRTMLGVDVSGSMSWSSAVGSQLTAAEGASAMAMVTARVEPYTAVYGFADTIRDLGISPEMDFATIMKKTSLQNFGRTDPSGLIKFAQTRQIKVDTFVVITDNEVNSGTHPSSALREYRNKMGIDAKLVVMGMTATNFSIADPQDRGMLDVVGFDSNAPKVVSDFSAGRF